MLGPLGLHTLKKTGAMPWTPSFGVMSARKVPGLGEDHLRYCSVGCGMMIACATARPSRQGDPDHPSTKVMLCPRDCPSITHLCRWRALHPLVRTWRGNRRVELGRRHRSLAVQLYDIRKHTVRMRLRCCPPDAGKQDLHTGQARPAGFGTKNYDAYHAVAWRAPCLATAQLWQ